MSIEHTSTPRQQQSKRTTRQIDLGAQARQRSGLRKQTFDLWVYSMLIVTLIWSRVCLTYQQYNWTRFVLHMLFLYGVTLLYREIWLIYRGLPEQPMTQADHSLFNRLLLHEEFKSRPQQEE